MKNELWRDDSSSPPPDAEGDAKSILVVFSQTCLIIVATVLF